MVDRPGFVLRVGAIGVHVDSTLNSRIIPMRSFIECFGSGIAEKFNFFVDIPQQLAEGPLAQARLTQTLHFIVVSYAYCKLHSIIFVKLDGSDSKQCIDLFWKWSFYPARDQSRRYVDKYDLHRTRSHHHDDTLDSWTLGLARTVVACTSRFAIVAACAIVSIASYVMHICP